MCFYIGVHDVARIEVAANGSPVATAQGPMHWWQSLRFFDHHGAQLGEITLHLADAAVALPLGAQPSYWGIDPRCPSALAVIDGESPF
jgi:hypothetical protein